MTPDIGGVHGGMVAGRARGDDRIVKCCGTCSLGSMPV